MAIDKLKNGTALGAIFGLLVASSGVSWIQSIVDTIIDVVPEDYQFKYIGYVVFGALGALAGYIIDKY